MLSSACSTLHTQAERENTRLKRLVADQALDNSILKEVASGNF